VDRLLPSIAARAVVIMGREDHTVTVAGARRLATRIGSGPAAFVLLERSAHLVGIDVERDRCAGAVAEFVAALPLPAGRGAPAGHSG
jgi:carboxylesterase